MATYLRQSLTIACLLTSILRALFCEVARPMVNWLFTERYFGTGMQMSRFNIQEHKITTEFSLYSSPRPITFSPGAAVAVAARLLWVGPTCQSIRGRFFRLTFLPRELSTNTHSQLLHLTSQEPLAYQQSSVCQYYYVLLCFNSPLSTAIPALTSNNLLR